jgi:hypothetical protein
MTKISNKSILTLSITAILVAGVFMFSPILVDAVRKQTCPTGQYVSGIDEKGNIICTAQGILGIYIQSKFEFVAPGTSTISILCDYGDLIIGTHSTNHRGGDLSLLSTQQGASLEGFVMLFHFLNTGTAPQGVAAAITCADTALPAHIP